MRTFHSTEAATALLVRSARIVGLVLLIGTAACGEASVDSGAASRGEPLVIEQDLRIDGHEADLVPITWLGVSPSGHIALVQWQDHNVRFFDQSGALIATFGGEGEGPGEFRRPVRGGWMRDTLWVSDTQLNRVTFIGPDMELEGTLSPPPIIRSADGDTRAREFSLSVPYGILSRDTLLVTSLREANGPEFTDQTGFPMLMTTTGGTLINVAAWLPLDEGVSVTVPVDRGVAYGQVPFYARPDWRISADGQRVALLTHEGDEHGTRFFQVRVYDTGGNQLVDRRFPFDPVPIPQARMDSAIAAAAARRPAIRAQMEKALRDAAPSTYPAAERVLIGQDHRVWIGLRAVDLGQEWIVLNEAGETAATVMLPPGVDLREASASHLWTVVRDELDVESVVRYRMVAAAR